MRKNFSSIDIFFFSALFAILLYVGPYFFWIEDLPLMIHDQLDSMFLDLKILAESGHIFSAGLTPIDNLANGLPRLSLSSSLFIPVWLVYFLGEFDAFALNQLIIRLIAFWGMHRLLVRNLIPGKENRIPAICASLCFSLLPFYSLFGLSVAGQPLILSGFLGLSRGRVGSKTQDWLIVLLTPFYSIFALGGFVMILIASVLLFLDSVRLRRLNTCLLKGIFAHALVVLMVESLTIFGLFGLGSAFESHRIEFSFDTPSIFSSFTSAYSNFMYGQEHARSLQNEIIIPSICVALLSLVLLSSKALLTQKDSSIKYLLVRVLPASTLSIVGFLYVDRLDESQKLLCIVLILSSLVWLMISLTEPYKRPFGFLVVLLILSLSLSLFYGFWIHFWNAVIVIVGDIPYVNLSRVHFLHPLVWYSLFGLALSVFWVHLKALGKILVLSLCFLQVVFLIDNSQEMIQKRTNHPTLKEFYSANLFDEIDEYIGRPKNQYRVVLLGLHPSIAAFNGYYTLDGYSSNYSLGYKREFRKLISGELERSESYRNYFDNWGSRYYVFSSELERYQVNAFSMTKETVLHSGATVADLQFGTNAFRALGGKYVFSAIEIENAAELSLRLDRVFERTDSPWRIFLYSVAIQTVPKVAADKVGA